MLSMEGQRALGVHQKYLNLCSEDERRSYGFGSTWGWVINDRIFIFGWTIPLSECWSRLYQCLSDHQYLKFSHVSAVCSVCRWMQGWFVCCFINCPCFSPESGRVSGSVSVGVSADGLRLLSSTRRELNLHYLIRIFIQYRVSTAVCCRAAQFGGGGGKSFFSFITQFAFCTSL